jgi:ribonuclease HI
MVPSTSKEQAQAYYSFLLRGQLKYVLQIHYKASNDGAEYEALIHRLRIVVSLLASSDYWLLAIPRSSLNKSTRSGTASRTRRMLIVLRFANSKAISRQSSSSMSHETIMWLLMYFPN